MGVAEGIAHPNEVFQLRRIQFVPAQRPDVTPVPTGVDIIVLNGVLPVSPLPMLSTHSHGVVLSKRQKPPNLQEEQDSSMKPGASGISKNAKELFREQDVSLSWKTVQRPVR